MTTSTALASAVPHRGGREQGQGSGGRERRKQGGCIGGGRNWSNVCDGLCFRPIGTAVQGHAERGAPGHLREFSPMVDPSYEPGRSGEAAIEVGRFVDCGLRQLDMRTERPMWPRRKRKGYALLFLFGCGSLLLVVHEDIKISMETGLLALKRPRIEKMCDTRNTMYFPACLARFAKFHLKIPF